MTSLRSYALAAVLLALVATGCRTNVDRDNPLDRDNPNASPGSITGSAGFDALGQQLGDVALTAIEVAVEGLPAVNVDSTGAFRVDTIRPGTYVVEVRAPYNEPIRIEAVKVDPAQATDLGSRTLRRGRGQVSGLILIAGQAAADAGCAAAGCPDGSGTQVSIADHPPGEPRFTVTNMAGAYLLTEVAAGPRRLGIRRDGYDPAQVEFELQPGEHKQLPEYTLGQGFSAHVSGSVLLEGIDPPSPEYTTVQVSLRGGVGLAVPDEQGHFQLASPLGGTFDLLAVKAGYERVDVRDIPLAQDTVYDLDARLGGPLVLRRARGAAKGTVSVNGATNDDVEVCVQGTGLCTRSTAPSGGGLGEFRIEGVPSGGTVQLLATKRAGVNTYTGLSSVRTIAAGPATDFGTIFLSFSGGDFHLRGRVYDPSTNQMEADDNATKEAWVAVDLAGVNTTGFGYVSRSFDGTFTTWLPLANPTPPDCTNPLNQLPDTPLCVMLPAEGLQTLQLKLAEQPDGTGRTLGPLKGSIVHDQSPPAAVALALNGGRAYVNATEGSTLSAQVSAQDSYTPLRWLRLAASSDPQAPDLSAAATQGYSAAPPAIGIPGFPAEGLKRVAIRVYDLAGNFAEATAAITLDRTAPTGVALRVTDANAALFVNHNPVTLELDRGGATDVTLVQLSNAPGMLPRTDVAYLPDGTGKMQTPWTLLGGADGTSRTVYAVFMDAAGNPSTQLSTTVTLDATPPGQPVVLIDENPCAGPVTDTRANGFTRNTQVCVTVIADADTDHLTVQSCASQPGSTTRFTCDLSPATDGLKAVAVTAVDRADNRSVAGTAYVTLDREAPPAPTLTLDRAPGAAPEAVTATKYVTSQNVVYHLTTAQESLEVQLEEAGPTGWFAATPTGLYTLASATNGVHSVKARVRDLAENVSPDSASDSVTLDTQAPATPAINPGLPSYTATSPLAGRALSTPDTDVWRFEVAGGGCASPCLTSDRTNPASFDFALTLNAVVADVIRVRAKDLAGNVGPDAVFLVTHDSTPPQTPQFPAGSAPVVNAPLYTATLASQPADPVGGGSSGVDHFAGLEYAVTTAPDCSSVSSWQAAGGGTSITFPLTENADNRLCVRSVDRAGNRSAGVGEFVVSEDSLPPPAPVFGPGVGATTTVNADSVFLWLLQPSPTFPLTGYDPGEHFDHFEVIGGPLADWTWLPLQGDTLQGGWGPDPARSPYDGRNFYEVPLLQDANNSFYFRAVDKAGNASTASPVLVYLERSVTTVASGDIRGAAVWGDRIAWSRQDPGAVGVYHMELGKSSGQPIEGSYSPFQPDQVSLWRTRLAFRDGMVRLQDLESPLAAPTAMAGSDPWVHGNTLVWVDTSASTANCPLEPGSGGSSQRVCRCTVDLGQDTGCAAGSGAVVSNDRTRFESTPRVWGNQLAFLDAPRATSGASLTGKVWTCSLATGCAQLGTPSPDARYITGLSVSRDVVAWTAAPSSSYDDGDVWTADLTTGAPATQWPNAAPVAWATAPVTWLRSFAWTDNRLGPPVVFARGLDWPALVPDRRASSTSLMDRKTFGMSGHRVLFADTTGNNLYQLNVTDLSSVRKLTWNGATRLEGSVAGQRFVWTDHRGSNKDIVLLDRGAGTEVNLTQGISSTQEQPAIAAAGASAYVVWRDERDGALGDIYGCRIDRCATPSKLNQGDATESQSYPSVSCTSATSCRVVWKDTRSSGVWAVAVDPSSTASPPPDVPVAASADMPGVSGDRVVYISGAEIRLRYFGSNPADPAYPCRLAGGVECRVSFGNNPSYPSISGNWVVWQQEAAGGEYSISAYDLTRGFNASTGAPLGPETVVSARPGISQQRPSVSGDWVVWLSVNGLLQDIYLYDLSARAEFGIWLERTASFRGVFDRPRIDGKTVIFTTTLGITSDVTTWEAP